MMRIRTRRILASVISAALLFTSMPSGVLAGEYADDEALLSMQEEAAAAEEISEPVTQENDETPLDQASPDGQEDVSEEEFLVAEDEDAAEDGSTIEEEDAPDAADGLFGLTAADLIEDPEAAREQDEETLTAADGEEYEYDREYNRTMLPGWDGTVNGFYGVHGPDGWEDRYEVTDVRVIEDSPENSEGGDVIDDFHRDSDDEGNFWWYYHVGNYGVATLEVVYDDVNGLEQSYTFNLIVGGDVYRVYMDSVGRERNGFPGDSIELYADASHEYLDENGAYHNDSVGLQYDWFFECGGDYADIIPDDDPSRVTLKFKDLPEGWDGINEEVRVGVRIKDSQGQDTGECDWTSFWVRSDYTEVVPLMLNRRLDVGASLENQVFEVRRYVYGSDEFEVLDDIYDVRYEWHYDQNVLRVTETVDGETRTIRNGDSASGNIFSFTRLRDWNSDYSVRAYWKESGEDRDVWGNYQLWNMNYDIGFDEHDLDVYTDTQSLPKLTLDIRDLGEDWENRLDPEVKVGHWTNIGDVWSDPLTEDTDYTKETDYDKGEITFTLTPDYLDKVEDRDDVRIWAGFWLKGAQQEEVEPLREADAWFHIREARVEYDLERNRTMLPGWDGTVDGSRNVHIENSAHPDGDDLEYQIIDVKIVRDEPWNPEQGDVIEILRKDFDEQDTDEYWWYYRVANPGEAELEVTYKDLEENEVSYTFTLFVGGDVYGVYMDSVDRKRNALPGDSIDLYADASHEYLDENGRYHNDSVGLQYDWFFECGGDYADIIPDDDPSRVTLKFKDLPDGWDEIDEEVRVGVRIKDSQGQDTEECDWTSFWVRSDYTEVVPLMLNRRLDVGGSLENQEFNVYRYELGKDGYEIVDDKYSVRYQWFYDESVLCIKEVTGGEPRVIHDGETGLGNKYTITRLEGRNTDYSVRACWKERGEDRDVWGNYQLWNMNYDIGFDKDDLDVYTDTQSLPKLTLDIRDLDEDWENRLDLEIKVGHWTDIGDVWSDPLTEDTDYTKETDNDKGEITFTLTQDYLDKVEDRDDVRIWAGVWLKGAQQEEVEPLREADAWFHIQKARSEYEFDWDEIILLPGWDHQINRWQWAWVCGSDVPDGEWEGDVEILDVTSGDPDIADVEYHEWDNSDYPEGKDHNWSVRAKQEGQTQITLTFRDWDNTPQDSTFTVNVASERYDMDIWHEGDSNIGLPGGSIVLHANIQHHIRDPKTGEYWDESPEEIAKTVQYVWSVEDDVQSQSWIKSLEYPDGNEHGDTVIVHLEELPEGWEGGIWSDLRVKVSAVSISDPEDVKAWRGQHLAISDSYYEVWVPGFKDRLWPGESQTVTPELRLYPSRTGNEAGYDVITEGVSFRWEYDENAVEVSGSTETGYTVRKLTDWGTDIRVKADFINDGREPDECEWNRNLQDIDTDFRINTPGGNSVYTDGSRKVELNLQRYEDAPVDLYSLEYEVTAWFPKNEDRLDWEERQIETGWHVEGQGIDRRLFLDGEALSEQYEDIDHYNVHAIMVIEEENEGDEKEIADTWQDFWLREPSFDYYNGVSFGDDNMFFGDTRILNGYYDGSRIRLYNSRYPDGEPLPFVITSVESVNTEEDPDDPRKAVAVERKTDGQGRPYFELTAVRNGEARITLGLNILDEDTLDQPEPVVSGTTTATYYIWVGDFRAWFDLKTDTGSRDVLAGNSIRIIPQLRAERQNPDYGHNEPVDTGDFVIEADAWTDDVHEDGFDNWDWRTNPLVMCSLEGQEGNWILQADEEAPDQRVCIEFQAYDYDHSRPYGEDNRWPIAGERIDIEVTHQTRVLEITGWDENMIPGNSSTITPSVKTYSSPADAGQEYVSPDLFYRIEGWYEGDPEDPDNQSEFEITDKDGITLTYNAEEGVDGLTGTPPFRVKRLADWDTGIDIVAYDRDLRGNEFELARRRLYVNRAYYPVSLDGKEGRGDDGYTWFYSNEEEIRLTPDLSALSGIMAAEPDKVEVELTYGRMDYDSSELKLNPLKNYTYNPADGSCVETEGSFTFADDEWSPETGLDLSGTTQERRDEITAILEQQDSGFHVLLQVFYGEDRYTLAEVLMWVEIKPIRMELEDDDVTILPGRPFHYDGNKASLYLEDADHCSGNERDDRPGTYFEVQITDIVSSDSTVLEPGRDEEGNWIIIPHKAGSAEITYTYTCEDSSVPGNSHTTTLHVADEVYYISSEEGAVAEDKWYDQFFGGWEINVLAETEESIRPAVWKRTYSQEKADAGEMDPYDWEKVEESCLDFDFQYLPNRFFTISTDGILTANGLQGEAHVNVYIKVYDSEEHADCIGETERDVLIRTVSKEVSFDLSDETVYALPGETVRMEDLRDQLIQHYRVRSLADTEWKPVENPDNMVLWFDGNPDEYLGMTLADAGFDTDYQSVKISTDILQQVQPYELSEDGAYKTWIRIGSIRDVTEANWLFAEGSLRLIVHNHVTVHTEPLEATYTKPGNIECWTCSVCGKHFSSGECTDELTEEQFMIPARSVTDVPEETNLLWSIQDGVLTISVQDSTQSSQMKSYSDTYPAPWTEAANELAQAGQEVTKIVVAEGVTNISDNAFAGLDKVTDVSLPKSLEEISATAFDETTVNDASFSFAGTDTQWKNMTEGTALSDKDTGAVHEHTWSAWVTVSKATIYKPAQQKRTCSGCKKTETRINGKKLRATIRLSAISGQIAAGKKVQITAQVMPGNVKNYPLKWTSSNPSVATVSASGLVSVNKKAGGKSVVITATSKTDASEKATFTIKVMKGAVKKIKITGKKSVKAGKSVKLKAKVTTTKGKANKKVQWISSNTAWATVAANGKVTATAAGKGKKVTITAMATDGSGKKKTFKISIK